VVHAPLAWVPAGDNHPPTIGGAVYIGLGTLVIIIILILLLT
jgi:hypothetical protein